MGFRAFLAILLCKLLRFVSRVLHRGGTAMPGRWALRVCPGLLGVLAKDVKTVAVTGTNGKTTSARMIEQAFADRGLSYFSNRSGANLLSGITTEFVMNSTLTGRCRKEYAVIECDEAASVSVFPQLRPRVILVTNLFRDQLDRYGEVTHTLANVRRGIQGAPEAKLCLNADCSLTASLADDLPNDCVFFGINPGACPSGQKSELSDAPYCIRCKTEYQYDFITYGHLGSFRCPRCGYRRREPAYAVTDIAAQTAEGSSIVLTVRGKKHLAEVNLPALYNVYNAVGAVAAVTEMGLGTDAGIAAVEGFKCGFGRMENFALGKRGAKMMLVKNPAGCNQVLDFLCQVKEPFALVVCLNDRGADGTDVSWIYDAAFEKLGECGGFLSSIAVSGDRAADMAVRLKYAGIAPQHLHIEHDNEALVQWIDAQEQPVFIIPTYTAMLELREAVIRRVGGDEFWV